MPEFPLLVTEYVTVHDDPVSVNTPPPLEVQPLKLPNAVSIPAVAAVGMPLALVVTDPPNIVQLVPDAPAANQEDWHNATAD